MVCQPFFIAAPCCCQHFRALGVQPRYLLHDGLDAAVRQARDGKIAVLTFHGVPDEQHPWVNTAPALFEKYLAHLKEQGCTVIAARDMVKYLPAARQ